MGRTLGIDLGLQRTGLAVSDELGLTTRGLPTLTPGSRAEDVAFLVELCRREGVVDVVVGLPLLPSGQETPWSKRVRGFAAALQQGLAAAGDDVGRVVVHLMDERGTSKEAAQRLVASQTKRSSRKALLDSEAARILIEDFLAARPRQGT
jgi:putative Holliday junction resolvase